MRDLHLQFESFYSVKARIESQQAILLCEVSNQLWHFLSRLVCNLYHPGFLAALPIKVSFLSFHCHQYGSAEKYRLKLYRNMGLSIVPF